MVSVFSLKASIGSVKSSILFSKQKFALLKAVVLIQVASLRKLATQCRGRR